MTAVSAPGKVLLAGGYLVLDRAYTALVFGLSARIHVLVRDREASSTETSRQEIVVKSPQFLDASWTYSYQVKAEDGGVDVIQLPGYEGAVALSFLRLTSFYLSAVSVPLFLPTSFTR
jgi:phosphomevalonate kinase